MPIQHNYNMVLHTATVQEGREWEGKRDREVERERARKGERERERERERESKQLWENGVERKRERDEEHVGGWRETSRRNGREG